MKIDLEELIKEFLLTLDDYNDEEYYMSNRQHASKWLDMFMDWMKKKHIMFIGKGE